MSLGGSPDAGVYLVWRIGQPYTCMLTAVSARICTQYNDSDIRDSSQTD